MKRVIKSSCKRQSITSSTDSAVYTINEDSYEIEEAVVSIFYLCDRDDLDEDVAELLAEIGADRGDYEFEGQELMVIAQYALDSAEDILDEDDLIMLNSVDFSKFKSIKAVEV